MTVHKYLGILSVLNSVVIVNATLQYPGNLFAATSLKCGFLFPHVHSFPQSIAFVRGITFPCVCKINLGWVTSNTFSLLFLTRYTKSYISIAMGKVVLHLVVQCLKGYMLIFCRKVYFSHCNCSYCIYTNFSMHVVEELGYGFIPPAKAVCRFCPGFFLVSFHRDFKEGALIYQLES